MKVAVVYRVVQRWRAPVFERLSAKYDDFKVFYGCDFPGTKVVSASEPYAFKSKKMFSIPISIRKKSGNILFPISLGLFFHLMRFKPDVVVCEGASNFLNNLFVFAYCKLFQKAMIQWGLGELKGAKNSLFRKTVNPLIKPVERSADAIICYSSYGTRYYRNLGIDEKKIFVAVNVVDTEKRFAEVNHYLSYSRVDGNDAFKILFVGALEPNKKVDTLISVFFELSKKHMKIELHIIGDGSSKTALEALCSELGISQLVKFYGPIYGPLAPVICGMDVFVMLGLGGLAVSDMLCHGIPVVCGVGDGCEGDLIDGNNGVVMENIDKGKIFDVLDHLINSPEILDSMKKHTKSSVEKYSIHNYINSISNAINYSVKHK